jgi:hypothetical protein
MVTISCAGASGPPCLRRRDKAHRSGGRSAEGHDLEPLGPVLVRSRSAAVAQAAAGPAPAAHAQKKDAGEGRGEGADKKESPVRRRKKHDAES